jgi:dTDP-4-dehydrorhamnose reductase
LEAKNTKKTKTILIFGISSFVGSNLAEHLYNDYKIIGTYYKTRVEIPGILTLPCDVLNKDEVQLVLFAFKPDVTIYAVGLSSVVDCYKNPELADALNTAGLINVTEYCGRYKSQICLISTAFVFNGDNKENVEMDIPDANTLYGKTMASAEFYIQKTSLSYIIFRTCRLYGLSFNPLRMNWFESLQHKLSKGESLVLDTRVKTGFLDVYYLSLLIKLTLDYGVTNRLFQISSVDKMSMFEFAKAYAKVFQVSDSLFARGQSFFPMLADRSSNRKSSDDLLYSLDITNIEGFLHVSSPTIEDSLKTTFKRLNGASKKEETSTGIQFI